MSNILTSKNAEVGMKVVRGPQWEFDNQDGGPGNIGKIIDVERVDLRVLVKWPNGNNHNYAIVSSVSNQGRQHLQVYIPESTKLTQQPPIHHLYPGVIIKIKDNQAHSEIEVGKEYEVISANHKFIVLNVANKEVEWYCQGNEKLGFFEVVKEAEDKKVVTEDGPPVPKEKVAADGHTTKEMFYETLKEYYVDTEKWRWHMPINKG